MALPFVEATRATLGLLTRRQGPEDFPYSPPLARGLGAAAALTAAVEFALQLNALAAVVAAVVQVLAIYWLLGRWLGRAGLANRLPQTFGALMACTAVLNLVEWPVMVALMPMVRPVNAMQRGEISAAEMEQTLEAVAPTLTVPTLLFMAVVVWGVAVKTRLLERALNIGFWRAAGQLTLLLLVASILGSLAASFFVPADERVRRSPPRTPSTAPAQTPVPERSIAS